MILETLYKNAKLIKQSVSAGSLMPVEGFARLVDITSIMVDYDIRDLVWGITIILDDMDRNRGPIWQQAPIPIEELSLGSARSPYYIQQDWLPFMMLGQLLIGPVILQTHQNKQKHSVKISHQFLVINVLRVVLPQESFVVQFHKEDDFV